MSGLAGLQDPRQDAGQDDGERLGAAALARRFAEALTQQQAVELWRRILAIASAPPQVSKIQIPFAEDAVAYHVRTAIVAAAFTEAH